MARAIDVVQVKAEIAAEKLAVIIENGSVLLKDMQSGEAVKIATLTPPTSSVRRKDTYITHWMLLPELPGGGERVTEHYTIPLPPVTKKNSAQIGHTGQKCPVCKRGKFVRLLPSKQYREYEEAALWCLQRREPIDRPVNVKCLFYMPTARLVDLTNLLEAADDALVTAGVLADDNSRIVTGHDGSRVLLDREKPRTEIFITEVEND